MQNFVNDTEEAVIASRKGTEELVFWGKKNICFLLKYFSTIDILTMCIGNF